MQFSVTRALAPQELSRENSFIANVSWQPSSFAMDTLAKNEFSRESSGGASARVTENCSNVLPTYQGGEGLGKWVGVSNGPLGSKIQPLCTI